MGCDVLCVTHTAWGTLPVLVVAETQRASVFILVLLEERAILDRDVDSLLHFLVTEVAVAHLERSVAVWVRRSLSAVEDRGCRRVAVLRLKMSSSQ